MEERARRRRTRLEEYDYSQSGIYFLTICAAERQSVFGDICVGGGALDAPSGEAQVSLSCYGTAVDIWIQSCADKYRDLSILNYVIMPNHVHMLVFLEAGPSKAPAPTVRRPNQRVPLFISALKRMTNKACGRALWQRGYHDHVVRNEEDYLRIWNYIDTNPAKWAEDKYFVPDDCGEKAIIEATESQV